MSNDSRAVAEVVLYIHMLWSSLEQVVVAMVLLIQLLGVIPAVGGVLFLLMVIPVQYYLIANLRVAREKASSHTDDRVKIVSEAIKGIKLVKLYAWELSFVKRILGHRAEELRELRRMLIYESWSGVMYNGVPVILTLVVFAIFVLLGNALDAAVIFPAISLFNILRPAMIIFPYVVVNCARAAASLSRLQKFLVAEELVALEESNNAVDQCLLTQDGLDILVKDAAFSWNPSLSAMPTLTSVSFSVPQGAFVAIVGPTGGGKSTLLSGLLGETPIVSGKAGILKGRSVAFCDQIAFIQNCTVRDNILFGKPFNEVHYRNTLRVCCLESDLEILPAGELTEIGGRGVNLSGGQRARVSLARAVYSRADICLFDDPLSAVDAHVGKSIFEECLVKQLHGKTRILTTNQVHFAASQEVDLIIVVKGGAVVEVGERTALTSCSTSEFSQLLQLSGGASATMNSNEKGNNPPSASVDENFVSSDSKESSETLNVVSNSVPDYGAAETGRLTRREEKEKGRVRIKHYFTYCKAMGLYKWALPIFISAILFNGFQMAVNVWMSYWSDLDPNMETSQSRVYNLFVFFAFGFSSLLAVSGMQFCVAFGSIRASVLMHEKLLLTVLGAPSSFFNATPDGRIVNRFTADLDKIDQSIASTLQAMNRLIISLIFALGLIIYVTPAFVFVAVPISAFCIYIQEYYRKTSVDLRRLEALARSPLYSHFSESLDGVVTLRAFGAIPRATHINDVYADQLNSTMYATKYANRWLALRLEGLGSLLIFFATLSAVLAPPGRISPGLAGLVLTCTVQMLSFMTWAVRQFTDMESEMSAVERVAEYSGSPFPQEEQGGLQNLLRELQPSSSKMTDKDSRGLISRDKIRMLGGVVGRRRSRWPKKGVIEFDQVEMRYRNDLAPALRDVSLCTRPGEHIGIVGRTGAGKSSAIQCLFRLYELEKGCITIDGVDISKLRLHKLRSSLGVIPQEPICFSGTIRTNLDMFDEHNDEEIEKALLGCGLQNTMREEVTLDYEVMENGSNLSVGQRQLLCLGRALLKDSQVLVLDEATSNVSNEIDEKIQETLRDEMSHCTILTVAHRLHTVMKSDRIIVMDKGRVAEVGRPNELLNRPSMLTALVEETGSSTAAHLRQLAFTAEEEQVAKYRCRKDDAADSGRKNVAESIQFGLSSDAVGVEDEPIQEIVRMLFRELKTALSNMSRKKVLQALTEVRSKECAGQELFSLLGDQLSLVEEKMQNNAFVFNNSVTTKVRDMNGDHVIKQGAISKREAGEGHN